MIPNDDGTVSPSTEGERIVAHAFLEEVARRIGVDSPHFTEVLSCIGSIMTDLHRGASAPFRDWVRCPLCEKPNMRRKREGEGYLIYCTNINCPSNGGAPVVITDGKGPERLVQDLRVGDIVDHQNGYALKIKGVTRKVSYNLEFEEGLTMRDTPEGYYFKVKA